MFIQYLLIPTEIILKSFQYVSTGVIFRSSRKAVLIFHVSMITIMFIPVQLSRIPHLTNLLQTRRKVFQSIMKPNPPLYHNPPRVLPFDLSAFSSSVCQREELNQMAYDSSRKLQVELNRMKTEQIKDWTTVENLLQSILLQHTERGSGQTADSRLPRLANLSYRFEDYVRLRAMSYFLTNGTLIPRSDVPYVTDEEYLAGAVLGLAPDLARYAMGRATVRDVPSVHQASRLVQACMESLLHFDFRNGPLRRKYDAVKYAIRTLETLLYELSVTGSSNENAPVKRPRVEDNDNEVSILPVEELESLRKRMEHRDNLRENLIKRCRDGQKAAKQAIYALHRNDKNRAVQLLTECEQIIQNDLFPIVAEEPPLRSGSFAGVLEEYAEAKMFCTWLFGKDDDTPMITKDPPMGDLLLPQEFSMELSPEEYLGGLCDLTGEIGRFAVQRGTARDTDGVKLCLFTNERILNALQSMERLPHGVSKKMEPLRRSVEKLERILYEMSLSEATGRNFQTSAEEMPIEDETDERG
jgi:predicted translin family RNA/ssDNA-binding protein